MNLYDSQCASCHELSRFKGKDFASAWADKESGSGDSCRISSSFNCIRSKQPNQSAASGSGWSTRMPSCCMPRKRLWKSA